MFVFVNQALATGRSDESKRQRIVGRVAIGSGVLRWSLVERAVEPNAKVHDAPLGERVGDVAVAAPTVGRVLIRLTLRGSF